MCDVGIRCGGLASGGAISGADRGFNMGNMEPRRFSDTPLHVNSTSSLVPGGFPARKSGKYSISTTTGPLTRKKVPRCNMSIRSCRYEVLVLYICMYEYIPIVLRMYSYIRLTYGAHHEDMAMTRNACSVCGFTRRALSQ